MENIRIPGNYNVILYTSLKSRNPLPSVSEEGLINIFFIESNNLTKLSFEKKFLSSFCTGSDNEDNLIIVFNGKLQLKKIFIILP